jgi:hypothetical protein
MALWLFRRKSRRKRARSSTLSTDDAQRPPARSQTAPEASTPAQPTRKQSVKRQRVESNKLQRRARTYSFESGRRDSIQVTPKKKGFSSGAEDERYDSGHDMGDHIYERVPTLHGKRDGQHLKPRKGSKKRKNSHDREREAELRAMSHFIPVRPATDAWTAGRPMKKDSRKVRTGLGLGLSGAGKGSWDKRHSSEVSLPIPESIHSSMSSGSDELAYKVSALSALAPKPTLRVTSFGRWGPPSYGSVPQRVPSERRRLSEKAPIPEATLRAHKRIHDLADDLSASDLRELMERDTRRRERKRQTDQEKVDRRLARRAERQRLAAEKGAQNLERGVIGREVGLGIDPSSSIRTSSKRRASIGSRDGGSQAGQDAAGASEEQPRRPQPQEKFHRSDSIPLASTVPVEEQDELVQEQDELVSPLVSSPKRKGFLRSKKHRSKSPLTEPEKAKAPDSSRRASESAGSRGPSWASFFKWGGKNKRTSGQGQPSFSNTSRDSMGTQPQPAQVQSTIPATSSGSALALGSITPSAITPSAITPSGLSRTVSSGVPRRTLSRFREDLPDFLVSPPNSRPQSHQSDAPPPVPSQSPNKPTFQGQERYGTPTSLQHTDDEENHQTSYRHITGPSPEPQHSMSMASIDSEASWLSGRLGNRSRSSQLHPRHLGTASEETLGSHHEEQAADEVANDEYMGRFVARRVSQRDSAGGVPRPSSDAGGDEEPRFGTMAQTAVLVPGRSVQSREGLLNMAGDDDDDDEDSEMADMSPVSVDSKVEEAGLQRATSVKLGQRHARHISAGSAKLLELSPRNSVDAKGRNVS